jgi:diguanylate cyclase (GGDEF)-like protein
MTRVKEEVSRMKRSEGTSSVIMIDVDKFKNFNDTYGHFAGDQVLEALAQVIKDNVRGNDIPSRFGGEEFTIFLPDAKSSTALMVAERLRTSVSKMRVKWEVELPTITISLGVFSFSQDDDIQLDDIIVRADEALYASKANGRNRTTAWAAGIVDGFPANKRDCGAGQ